MKLSICLSLLLAGCAAVPAVPMSLAAEAREILAPTGRLRAGTVAGDPTGVGRELARQLRVPFEPMVFEREAELFDALTAGQVDVVFVRPPREHQKVADFSPPCLDGRAIGIRKGRERALPFLREFVEDRGRSPN